MNRERLFLKSDWLAALICSALSFAVYFFTAAPNVTLLDSGEFLVAAQHFGVPHPTGYPLWTILSWLFQLLPLGNAAWEIALLSGIFASLAVGLTALLLQSTLRWIFHDTAIFQHPIISHCISVGCALLLAFSQSMWSQAVIAEVYGLHAFLVVLFLICQYAWIRNPASMRLLLLSFFLLSLSFSNHQLALALAPLPFLGVLLLRRDIIWDLIIASLLTLLLVYLGFAILSMDSAVLKTAIRFFFFVMAAFLILVAVRRFQIRWNLIAYLPFVIIAGILPYLYMPLASSTNPPMNWGYTRTVDGFYYSFNRSQYGGSLSDQSLRSLGKLMGVSNPKEEASAEGTDSFGFKPMDRFTQAQRWCGFFWLQMTKSFTPAAFLAFIVAILVILRVELRQRVWVYFLILAFVLAAFLQPILDGAGIDQASWWTQMPYHTYTNLIYALIIGVGFAWIFNWLASKRPRLVWLGAAIPLLALWPLFSNYAISSQRGNWFGWQFGHDMLKDLPKGAVVFGGTDPGRFVPTYMILGESTQPAKDKRDPNFDRRDLFIITQNGLADPFYLKYIRDHYSSDRPVATTAFEKYLGRENAYPKDTLILPTSEEQKTLLRDLFEKPDTAKEFADNLTYAAHSAIAKWIFDKNKDKHDFFIEESFPMTWTYDYAVPNGLSYRLEKEPGKPIPREAVGADFRFWDQYVQSLLNNPLYHTDYDAKRSFAKLRNTIGNIYRHRKMDKEAEAAYRQALALWPGCVEAMMSLNAILWKKEKFEEVKSLILTAIENDSENLELYRLLGVALQREEIQNEIQEVIAQIAKAPKDAGAYIKLISLRQAAAETELVTELIEKATNLFPTNADILRLGAIHYSQENKKDSAITFARRLAEVIPSSYSAWLLQAQILSHFAEKEKALESLKQGWKLGGTQARVESESVPELKDLDDEPAALKVNESPDSKQIPQSPGPVEPAAASKPTPASAGAPR